MNQPPDPHSPRPIDYASVPPPRRRVSILAVMSLLLAVLTSPGMPLYGLLDGPFRRLTETPWFFVLVWTGVLTLAIIAMRRVYTYKETRFGFRIAAIAIIICAFWIAVMCRTFLFEIPAQD